MGDRLALTEFWEKQAHAPTVQTMMLNKLAEKVDEQDKRDILDSLPDLDDMHIVELGAGIGRFTPILAAKAEHVIAADIVESFIEMNRKHNEHMGNITFLTGEANQMKVDGNSIHLLFTNWLLMYLTDVEVIRLLKNALSWLSAGGFMHIRESCSEPSKRNSISSTPVQADTNPTHYRHICQYLDLLKTVSIHDDVTNQRYAFNVLWSKSVDTYVEAYGNWRQVQILVKKVVAPALSSKKCQRQFSTCDDESSLLKVIRNDSLTEQSKFDACRKVKLAFFKERGPAAKFLLEAMVDLKKNVLSVLNVALDDHLSMSPFEISQKFDCKVCDVERSPYAYNAGLTEAVRAQDKRVRLHWSQGLDSAEAADWSLSLRLDFDLIVGCRLIAGHESFGRFFANAKEHLMDQGKLLLLEEAENEQSLRKILTDAGCKVIKIKDVTAEFQVDAMKRSEIYVERSPILSSFYQSIVESNQSWFLVEAN